MMSCLLYFFSLKSVFRILSQNKREFTISESHLENKQQIRYSTFKRIILQFLPLASGKWKKYLDKIDAALESYQEPSVDDCSVHLRFVPVVSLWSFRAATFDLKKTCVYQVKYTSICQYRKERNMMPYLRVWQTWQHFRTPVLILIDSDVKIK